MPSSIEERVARLETEDRRRRLVGLAKAAFYAFIIIGVVVYLAGLYSSLDEWRVEPAAPPRIGVEAFPVVKIEAPVRVYNPDGDVTARLVYYRVYVNGYYAGDGFIPYLRLSGGWSEHVLEVKVDVARLGCGVAKALSGGGKIRVRVEGYAVVDLKAFGVVPWRSVTVPFNASLGEAEAPRLDPATRSAAALIAYACRHSGDILRALTSTGGLPAQAPPSTLTPGSMVSAEILSVEPTLRGYAVEIRVVNNGESTVTVTSVRVNGVDRLEAPVSLAPGESRVIIVYSPTLPVTVTVETTAGSINLTPVG